jgi:signal transduction histidine kinase/CheY-like chemotaxis protein
MDLRELVPTLADQQLDQILRRSTLVRLTQGAKWSILSLLLAGVVAPHVSRWSLIAWLVVQAMAIAVNTLPSLGRGRVWNLVAAAVRRCLPLGAPKLDSTTTQLQAAVPVVGVLGLTSALSLLFFASLPLLERICQAFLLMQLANGAAVGAVGYRPLMHAVTVSISVPLAILWLVIPSPSGPSALHMHEAVLGMLVILTFAVFAQHATIIQGRRSLMETFDMRVERANLARALSASLEAAETANRAKTRFLASASHDLRQPIHAVSLFAAALALRPLDARSHEIARCINHALQDLSIELNALLDISKLDAGTVRAQLHSIELLPLLQRLQHTFAGSAHTKGLELLLECPSDAWVRTDRVLLERIVRNLLENAIKYTDSGQITIQVQPQIGSYRLSVADSGCGIAEVERERVFEEFYQVGNAARDRRCGLGLGLSIVKRLAHLLQLPLQMHSRVGEGTVFSLDLAMATSTVLPVEPLDPLLQPMPQARVLVLDDEAAVCEAMRALLEEMGYAVTTVASTDAALRVIESESPDLLIADFRLPCPGGGLAAIAAARVQSPTLAALLITGDTAPDRLRQAHAAGIPVLHKPVGAEILQEALSQLLSVREADLSQASATR